MMKIIDYILFIIIFVVISSLNINFRSFGNIINKATAQDVGQVRISELDNPYPARWRGEQNDLALIDDVCAFSSSGYYRVKAVGSNSGYDFSLNKQDDNISLPYLVYWNDNPYSNTEKIQLISNRLSEVLTTTSQIENNNCNNGQNLSARLEVLFRLQDLMKANPGNYFGILIITIEPI
jgi:hypothetical protein